MKTQRLPLLLLFLAVPGCQDRPSTAKSLTLATTTSTQDSGLLDVLVPLFRQKTGVDVKVVAVGSGQALELGRRGDADVLLTHSPGAEEKFMADGFGAERRSLMHNDFVLLGPKAEVAQIKGNDSAVNALRRIAGLATFVSRGDDSGTHQKEQQLWQKAEIRPEGEWYISAGTSMGQVLRIADQEQAYTLSDRATFLALRADLELVLLVEGDVLLMNPYSVILVSSDKHAHVNHENAASFINFLFTDEVQRKIAEFGTDAYGEPLFFIEE